MPTPFSERSPLPGPPAAVFALLTDPGFLAERAVRSGAVEHTEEVGTEGSATVVRSTRTVGTAGLPRVAAGYLGATAVVEQVERWEAAGPDGSRSGSLELTVRGAPVRLEARARLQPAGDGCEHELTGALSVDVPLFGGSVEQAALPGLLDLVRAEVQLARERLTG
ncbi:DUF2505 domain-containing protein [Paenibacillus sp. TRM 82003]|uniref:DUF2505 domain-containing protein n=1 Tax=Kineococcus sp. TRM81007 TaxID=2925831 RepID=UPI001F55C016|nr:DUF2505 domain-containing protein [Kineococcus sp. TRM81007]MCI2239764.1 DUF2505 domain-containing protein [Kineococcus sp. TRM81007]MCI3925932.1 DUF2505 domain-containing protein [Paenibacillus sp. TRM 82003]